MPKWCDQGENNILDCYLKGAIRPSFYLGLFTNTTEPAENATLADLTEPGAGAYARIQLADVDWTIVNDLATHAQKTFTANGGNFGNCYGYFICTAAAGTSGLLIACELFSDGPYNVLDGGSVKITPKVIAA